MNKVRDANEENLLGRQESGWQGNNLGDAEDRSAVNIMLMTAFLPEVAGTPNDITVDLSPNSLSAERDQHHLSESLRRDYSKNMQFKWEQ